MRYTNKYQLPEAVYYALTRDTYNKGNAHYSVTEMLNPPQIVQLKRRYDSELEEDVMDNVWSLLGKAAHHILENHAPEDSLSEERLSVTILDRVLSGQTDNYHNGVISDYKITSAYTLVYGSRIHEWEAQLNSYAYIFRQHGHEVKQLQAIAILRDWSKHKAKADPKTYPQNPIVVIPLNLWTEEEQELFLTAQLKDHIFNEELPDNELKWCLAEEMWEQPTKYAVMKEGRKTAVRVFDTKFECEKYISEEAYEQHFSIQERSGKRTRCEEYCPVKNYCHQYKRYCNGGD